MLKRLLFLGVLIAAVSAGTAFADGCKTYKLVGSYLRVDAPSDVFGDGAVVHQYMFSLVLNTDGSAVQNWTGSLDFPINTGTVSASFGSWMCRSDGKLLVTFLLASYNPTAPGPNHPLPDVSLIFNQRLTYLFTVDDDNTLTRIQARARTYGPADDPRNLTGGTLGPLSTRTFTYKRIVASDADLLAP